MDEKKEEKDQAVENNAVSDGYDEQKGKYMTFLSGNEYFNFNNFCNSLYN